MSGSFRRNVGVGGPGREDRAGEPESVPAEAGPVGRPSSLLVTAAHHPGNKNSVIRKGRLQPTELPMTKEALETIRKH